MENWYPNTASKKWAQNRKYLGFSKINDGYEKSKLINKKLDQTKTENVYVFTNDHNISDEECGVDKSFELKQRIHGTETVKTGGNASNQSLIDYIDYEIQPNDTLASIALRYHCSVAKIKQINHMISEQDFYGLRVIKVPINKYGVLTDIFKHQQNTKTQLTVNIGISQHMSNSNSEDAFKFLRDMDNDLKAIRESTKSVIETSNVDSFLNKVNDNSGYRTAQQNTCYKTSAFFSCDESDYGINWYKLLILAFVLCFLVPIIYVIYLNQSNDHLHTHNH